MSSENKIVKNHFNSAAIYYGINDEFSPLSHIFETRKKRVSELLPDLSGLRVLSVGCGPAPMVDTIKEKEGEYFGVDLALEMLYEAHKRHVEEKIILSEANIHHLPFQNNSFDVILCLGALEYISDINHAIEEFSRVIKDDGFAIISMQNKFSLYRLWDDHIFSSYFINALRRLWRRPILDKPFEKPVPLSNLKKTFVSNSLIVTNLIYYNFIIWLKPLDRFFPKLCILTTRKLEFLYKSRLGLLAADFILKAQKSTKE